MLIDKNAAIAAIRRLEIDGPQMIWSSDAIDAVKGVEPDALYVPDVGKVIRGLEICSSGEWNSTGGRDHTICPYYPAGYTGCTCKLLMRDALALIEAQRKTLDEIDQYVRELDKAVNGNERTVSCLGAGNVSRYDDHVEGQ